MIFCGMCFFQVPYLICEKVPLLADIVIYRGQFFLQSISELSFLISS